MVRQIEISLPPMKRGYHLITNIITSELKDLPQIGLLNIFTKHTSCGLTINENADLSVRQDFETVFNDLIPENRKEYRHTSEGIDDMPAHIKTSILGVSINIPISGNCLNLGTWQGIYFCEFRNYGGGQKLVLTVFS